MKCPKCEEGNIVDVILKVTGESAKLCNFCDNLWLEGEDVKFNTGHIYDSLQGNALEYNMGESEHIVQEHRDVKFPRVK